MAADPGEHCLFPPLLFVSAKGTPEIHAAGGFGLWEFLPPLENCLGINVAFHWACGVFK